MGPNHPHFAVPRYRDCTLPSEYDIQDEITRLDPEDSLLAKIQSDDGSLVENSPTMRSNPNLCVHLIRFGFNRSCYELKDLPQMDMRPGVAAAHSLLPSSALISPISSMIRRSLFKMLSAISSGGRWDKSGF
jgi:hypothetical protein